MGIKEFINNRGIKSLYHFTNFKNLKSILDNGLVCRQKLEKSNIIYYYNDNLRLENKKNAICISISFPNYKMFYKCRQDNLDAQWCVIELDPSILYKKKCLFCVTNAADKTETIKDDKLKIGVNALEKLFYDDECRVDFQLPEQFTTNPQAEVLVLDDIEKEYIKSVNFDVEEIDFDTNKYKQIKFYFNRDLFDARVDYNNW